MTSATPASSSTASSSADRGRGHEVRQHGSRSAVSRSRSVADEQQQREQQERRCCDATGAGGTATPRRAASPPRATDRRSQPTSSLEVGPGEPAPVAAGPRTASTCQPERRAAIASHGEAHGVAPGEREQAAAAAGEHRRSGAAGRSSSVRVPVVGGARSARASSWATSPTRSLPSARPLCAATGRPSPCPGRVRRSRRLGDGVAHEWRGARRPTERRGQVRGEDVRLRALLGRPGRCGRPVVRLDRFAPRLGLAHEHADELVVREGATSLPSRRCGQRRSPCAGCRDGARLRHAWRSSSSAWSRSARVTGSVPPVPPRGAVPGAGGRSGGSRRSPAGRREDA